MSGHTTMRVVLPLVEKGLVPTPLIRWGIRRLQKARLTLEASRQPTDEHERTQRFIERLRHAPIAPLPEKANEQHYEVPSALFAQVLGPHLKYSGCYWPSGTDSLESAEAAMLALTCERAQLEDGMDILELGCGWGSLALWIGQHYPTARVVAVSNSNSQRRFIEKRCAEMKINNVRVVTADMNDFSTGDQFDRVVSVEMFEHMRNYELLLQRIATWLRPAGKLFVHVFCHSRFPYFFEATGADDWMGRYFFTAGLMPSFDLLPAFDRDLVVEEKWWLDGSHYARTAEAWATNLQSREAEVLPILADVYGSDARTWLVRWHIFFLACAELFWFNKGTEWGVGHYRFCHRS